MNDANHPLGVDREQTGGFQTNVALNFEYSSQLHLLQYSVLTDGLDVSTSAEQMLYAIRSERPSAPFELRSQVDTYEGASRGPLSDRR